MTRISVALVVILGVAAATLYGADFWEKKKFTEWNEKEVRRMLTDSPWAHSYEIMGGGGGFAPGGGGGGRAGGRRGGGGGGFSAESGIEGGGGEGGGSMGGGPARPIAVLQFRILSALPVKQAIARVRFGTEVESPDAVKLLSRQETAYIVSITGLPARMLEGADAASLKNTTQLKVKNKPAAYPRDLQIQKNGPMIDVYAFFSREDTPIVVEDKEFEVIFKIPNREIKRTFKLKDMVYNGKLEI
ncbi:MAG TPA: hypothetical protein PLP04_18635 [Bryobacteraceae bacterium]|nr:hypothetical protein [Bryobacteraceae bacterium]